VVCVRTRACECVYVAFVCVYISMYIKRNRQRKRESERQRESGNERDREIDYGVATISRLIKIIGLLCTTSSLLMGSFAKKPIN